MTTTLLKLSDELMQRAVAAAKKQGVPHPDYLIVALRACRLRMLIEDMGSSGSLLTSLRFVNWNRAVMM